MKIIAHNYFFLICGNGTSAFSKCIFIFYWCKYVRIIQVFCEVCISCLYCPGLFWVCPFVFILLLSWIMFLQICHISCHLKRGSLQCSIVLRASFKLWLFQHCRLGTSLSFLCSIWSRSEQFEAASQSELLIGVAHMSVLQLPWLGSALAPCSHTANRRKLPTHVPFAFASRVFLVNQLVSLAAHVELDSVQDRKRRQMEQKKMSLLHN